MIKRLTFLVTALTILASTIPAAAQQPSVKGYRIGFITSGSAPAFRGWVGTFREGLRDLGYVEGENIASEERYGAARYEKMPELAAELVRLGVDVIVTHGGRWARLADRTARQANKTIPIVFAVDPDPVGRGIVASLAHPGGNITGLSDSHSELVAKRLELLKEVVPAARRIAVVWNPANSISAPQLKTLQAVAPRVGVTIVPVAFTGPNDLERAFAAIRGGRVDAINALGFSQIVRYRRQIAAFARDNRLAAISTMVPFAKAGGLMTYGVRFHDLYRRAATFVDKILKGTKPADLPVEQPTRFYLTVNLKTAKALGITFPPSILLRADHVIE